MRIRVAVVSLGMVGLFVSGLTQGCDGGDGNSGGGGTGGVPSCTDCTPTGDSTYALPSPAGAVVWTTTTMDKVLREAAPPSNQGQAIQVRAAKNEFEPIQVVVRADTGGSAQLTLSNFEGPGALGKVEIRRVEYVTISEPSDPSGIPSGQIPDPLDPTSFGTIEPLPNGENQPFWITVHIPKTAAAGDYTATLHVDVNGNGTDIPVELHVFDFTLPDSIGFDGNWNSSFQSLGGSESLEKVRELKDFFFEHRLVPSSVAWPAGLNYTGGITYDCASASFVEENNPYDFSQLGPEYIDGTGWNDVGFPSFEIMQFVDNSTPRPSEFCGVSRGDSHFGTDEYNAEWSKLLQAIEAYLIDHSWTGKGYYYVQNEPQGPADYDVAAFLAKLIKDAAPSLRIAVSEEPKPEIAEHPMMGDARYDLWWADLSEFEPEYAATRQAAGDEVWWYFLYGDLPPHFNPITIDHSGIESRIPFWSAYTCRVKGFAYYSVTGWGDNPRQNPRPQGTNQNGDGFLLYPPINGKVVTSIRWENLREGAEDYEYLRLAAGGTVPNAPGTAVGCDVSAQSAAASTTSFTHDTSAFKHLRDELGYYLEGQRDGCPVLDSKPVGAHPKAAYYINFQDPNGEPSAEPLTADGHEWTKIGWEGYNAEKGYGWSGPYIGDTSIMLTQYLADAPVSEIQKSIIYNDYGRTDTFNWDIENGTYLITVSIGWYDKTYSKHRVFVEGQPLFDSVETSPAEPYKVGSIEVTITDGNITMEAGQKDEYTMLNWMSIEPQ
ncbi:MAG: DUF4091 domain-containing protein [Polyangiaceae bacterium]|nr:DUF4091 domain-containing protein [Polyangiaceae bacterium]